MRCLLVALVLLVLAGDSRAGLVVIEDARYVHVDGATPETLLAAPNVEFLGGLEGSGWVAQQHTSLDPTGFVGSGLVRGTPGCCAVAESVFDVLFTSDRPQTANLYVVFGSDPEPSEMVTAYFSDSLGQVQVIDNFFSGPVQLSPAVQYRLVVAARTSTDFSAQQGLYNVFVTLSTTPEPGPMLALLALAILGFARGVRFKPAAWTTSTSAPR
jgi:hypothetical protein